MTDRDPPPARPSDRDPALGQEEGLRSLVSSEAEFARLEARQQEIQAQIRAFRAADRLDRDELHGRAVR